MIAVITSAIQVPAHSGWIAIDFPVTASSLTALSGTAAGALSGVVFMILLGWLSDRVGRKKPLVIGYVLGIVLIFPYFHLMAANAGSPVTLAGLLILAFFVSTLSYATLAAWLVELFPARIRYTSMSLPYHIGNGWFGGFLPVTSFAIVAATGNIYNGLWYPIVVALVTVVIGSLFLRETKDSPA